MFALWPYVRSTFNFRQNSSENRTNLYNNGRIELFQNRSQLIQFIQIDSLSRVSLFDEAQNLIDEFELSHQPWLSMHSRCVFYILNM